MWSPTVLRALNDPKQRRALHEMKARLEKKERQDQKRKEKGNNGKLQSQSGN